MEKLRDFVSSLEFLFHFCVKISIFSLTRCFAVLEIVMFDILIFLLPCDNANYFASSGKFSCGAFYSICTSSTILEIETFFKVLLQNKSEKSEINIWKTWKSQGIQ